MKRSGRKAFGGEDSRYFTEGLIDTFVDDPVTVAMGLVQFAAGDVQPASHRLRRLGATALEPLEQLVGV